MDCWDDQGKVRRANISRGCRGWQSVEETCRSAASDRGVNSAGIQGATAI